MAEQPPPLNMDSGVGGVFATCLILAVVAFLAFIAYHHL